MSETVLVYNKRLRLSREYVIYYNHAMLKLRVLSNCGDSF